MSQIARPSAVEVKFKLSNDLTDHEKAVMQILSLSPWCQSTIDVKGS